MFLLKHKNILAFALVILFILAASFSLESTLLLSSREFSWWEVQSIDVMKYSRDIAREKLTDPSFDSVIDQQVRNIVLAGATHIAIGTPYDEEFLPFLKRWVKAARKYNLNVWFRGNWSGWEKWFGYAAINREEHIQKTENFILDNEELFADGDIFTACTECENGGPGDPRFNNDAVGHKKFLIDEYMATKQAFGRVGKNVASNYNSMNGDVARLIMDPATTSALDGIVVVDHYVSSYERLASDIKNYADISGGRVVLGEFGVPVPNLHGNMSEEEQAKWLDEAFKRLTVIDELEGVNYWVSVGGSTQLWDGNGTPRKAVEMVQKYYSPKLVSGKVVSEYGNNITSATISYKNKKVTTDRKGQFEVPYLQDGEPFTISAPGYEEMVIAYGDSDQPMVVTLVAENENIFMKAYKYIRGLVGL